MTRLEEIDKQLAELEAEGPASYNDYGEADEISVGARAVAAAELEGEKRGLEAAALA